MLLRVYENEAFDERVRYAKECLVTGQTESREFDTCLEMFDGDLVMVRLMQDAERDWLLAETLQRYDISWLKTKLYPLLKDRAPSELTALAKTLREQFHGDIRTMFQLGDSED